MTKKIKNKTLKGLKKDIKKKLPDKILKIIEIYDDFIKKGAPEDMKDFLSFHNAGRAAVNHIETLLKLTKWGEENADKNKTEEDNVLNFLLEARRELSEFVKEDES